MLPASLYVASFFVLSSMYECMLADRVCVCACSNMSGKSLGDVWCRVCDILGARTLMTSVWFVWVRSIWGQFLRRLTALIVRNSISASWALIQLSSLQWESNPCNQSQRQDTQTCRESFIIYSILPWHCQLYQLNHACWSWPQDNIWS